MQWALLFAADSPPAAPPDVPYEAIATTLVGLMGLMGVILVAIIQRGKRDNAEPEQVSSSPPPTPVFVISKDDWNEVRDLVLRLNAQFEQFRQNYDYFERKVDGETDDLGNQISHIKGHLGI